MKTLLIVAHPNMQNSQVNKTWVNAVKSYSDKLTVHELYTAYPDGKINAAKEQALVETHGSIVFQFPVYWFSSPPLLKQWQDEVLTYGWAYGSQGKKLHRKQFGIAVSMGGSLDHYTGESNIKNVLKPFELMAFFVGMIPRDPFTFYGANRDIHPKDIENSAEQYRDYILSIA